MWISRAKLKEMKDAADAVTAAIERAQQLPVLVSIERVDRLNKFTFAKGDKLIQIETMGLISDDFGQWRKDLGV